MAHTNALSRLLQLASPMLPVGAYSYSQGLEWAIESQAVTNAPSAQQWIAQVLETYQAHFELPLLLRSYQAWRQKNWQSVQNWDVEYQAGRDCAEALAESRQMGYSLRLLCQDIGDLPKPVLTQLQQLDAPAFITVFACLCHAWKIAATDMLHAYAWSWAENQVSAAMKTVPLGQVAGQKMLLYLGQLIPSVVTQAGKIKDNQLSNFCPALTIAGCLHETQYTRLFRS